MMFSLDVTYWIFVIGLCMGWILFGMVFELNDSRRRQKEIILLNTKRPYFINDYMKFKEEMMKK